MRRWFKRNLLWLLYAVFLILAVSYGAREGFFSLSGSYAGGKVAVLAAYLSFLAYSLYASQKENFFKSVRIVNSYLWGLQIGLDLYISVFLSLALIYFVEGSFLVLAIWLVPVLFFANLAILPYIIINYSTIIDKLAG